MQKRNSLPTILTLLLFFSGTTLNAQNITGQLTDERDQETYKTVKIGSQWWMAENLNFKKDSSWVYDNNDENSEKFGRLYTWQSAMSGCPADWHLPTDKEWMELESTLGMLEYELETPIGEVLWKGLVTYSSLTRKTGHLLRVIKLALTRHQEVILSKW